MWDKIKSFFKNLGLLLKDTAVAWGQDRAAIYAASLAYYTIFSLAPLLIIAIAVASLVFREAAVEGELVGQLEGFFGSDLAAFIQSMINANQGTSGLRATLISFGLMLLGASGVFNQLRIALNRVWNVVPPPDKGLLFTIKARLWSFLIVLGIGFLLLILVVLNTSLTAFSRWVLDTAPGLGRALPLLNLLIFFTLSSGMLAVIYKALPDAQVAWRDVMVGAVVTALLIGIGIYLIGFYIGNWSGGATYGAASSLVVLLLWIYFSAQIFLFGAEFTRAYANRFGSKIRPVEGGLIRTTEQLVEDEPEAIVPGPEPLPEWELQQQNPGPRSMGRRWAVASGLLGMATGLLLAYMTGGRRS